MTDEQNVPENCTTADIVRALNNIHAELRLLNQNMAKAPAAPAAPRAYGHSAGPAPMTTEGVPGGRPRLSGAAGRVHGKTARSDRQDKGGKFTKFGGSGGKSPSSGKSSGGGYPKRPSK